MNHLEKNEAKHIIHLLSGIFSYANEKDGYFLKEFGDMNNYLYKGCKKVFLNEKTSKEYIDEYLHYKSSIKYRDQKIIRAWAGAYKRELYSFGDHDQYSYIFDRSEKQIYGAKGLSDSLGVTLKTRPLPTPVWYTLLPYKDGLICDALDMTKDALEIPEVMTIYEEFREAGIKSGVKLSETQFDEICFVDREQEDPSEVFREFMQPFLMCAGNHKDLIEHVLRWGAYAWNECLKSDEEKAAEDTGKKVDQDFVDECIRRKQQYFAKANFRFEQFDVYSEHGTLKIRIK